MESFSPKRRFTSTGWTQCCSGSTTHWIFSKYTIPLVQKSLENSNGFLESPSEGIIHLKKIPFGWKWVHLTDILYFAPKMGWKQPCRLPFKEHILQISPESILPPIFWIPFIHIPALSSLSAPWFSRKNGCISNRIVTFQRFLAFFHWTMEFVKWLYPKQPVFLPLNNQLYTPKQTCFFSNQFGKGSIFHFPAYVSWWWRIPSGLTGATFRRLSKANVKVSLPRGGTGLAVAYQLLEVRMENDEQSGSPPWQRFHETNVFFFLKLHLETIFFYLKKQACHVGKHIIYQFHGWYG